MALHSGGLFSKPHQLHWLLDAAQLEFQSLRLWGAWQLQHAIWTPSSLPKLAGGWWFMWFAMTVTLPEMLGAIYCMHVIFLSARNGKSKLCIFWDVFLSSQCFFCGFVAGMQCKTMQNLPSPATRTRGMHLDSAHRWTALLHLRDHSDPDAADDGLGTSMQRQHCVTCRLTTGPALHRRIQQRCSCVVVGHGDRW